MRNSLKFTDTHEFDAIFGSLRNGYYEADANYGAFMLPSGKIVELFSDHTVCHLPDTFRDCIGYIADFYADAEIDNDFTTEFMFVPTAVYKNINIYSHRNIISIDMAKNQLRMPVINDERAFIQKMNALLFKNSMILKSEITLGAIQHYYHNIHHMYGFMDDESNNFIASDELVDNLNGLLALNQCVIRTFIQLANTGVNMKRLFNNFLESKYTCIDFFIMACGIGKVESSVQDTVTISKLSYFHTLHDFEYELAMIPELVLNNEFINFIMT